MELSAADAGLEGCACAGGRLHGCAQARRIHAAFRLRFCRNLQRSRAAARRLQPRQWRRLDGRRHRRSRCLRQDRLHRLYGGWPHFAQADRRQRKEAVAGTGRQVAIHRLLASRYRCGGGRSGRRHLVQPGRGVLRRFARHRAGGHRRQIPRQAQGAHGKTAHGRSARQGHRYWRCGRSHPDREHRGARRRGQGVGRAMLAALMGGQAKTQCGLLLSADPVHRGGAFVATGTGRGVWSGDRIHDLPHAGRGHRIGQQFTLRAGGLGLEPESRRRLRLRPVAKGRDRLDQLDQFIRRRCRFRRLP